MGKVVGNDEGGDGEEDGEDVVLLYHCCLAVTLEKKHKKTQKNVRAALQSIARKTNF
jgi:hypothetical protein